MESFAVTNALKNAVSGIRSYLDAFSEIKSYLEAPRRLDELLRNFVLLGTSQESYFDIVFQKSRPSLYDDKYEDRPPLMETQEKLNLARTDFFANLGSVEELKYFMLKMETQEKLNLARTDFFANLGSVEELKYFMLKMETQEKLNLARTDFFANLGSVEELKYFMLKMKRVLHYITDTTTESTSPAVGFHNFSVSEEFRLAVLNALDSKNWERVESMIMPIAAAFPGRAAMYDAYIIALTSLLLVVYQNLISLVDRGGGRTYSSGSLEFRSIYISIVLFQGAYVWIKFRDVAPESEQRPPRGVYRRSRVNEGVIVYYGNYEPRFKPPGSNYISVGSYEKEEDAKTLYQILAFYYGKDSQGELPLLGDSTYPIPPMTEAEQRFDRREKKEWVKGKAKAVLEEYKEVMDSILIDCLMNSQPTQEFVSMIPLVPACTDAGTAFGGMEPSDGVQAEAHPFFGNQAGDDRGDDLQSAPRGSCIPGGGPVTRVTQEVQLHMANDTFSDHIVGDASHSTLPDLSMRSVPEPTTNVPANGAAISREQPLELQPLETRLYHRSWQENQATNSAINVIPDDPNLRRQVKELQRQLQFQQRRYMQLESRNSASKQQQYHLMSQLESRFSQFQQHQQLQTERLESRISDLEEELERSRSTEHDRKRFRLWSPPTQLTP